MKKNITSLIFIIFIFFVNLHNIFPEGCESMENIFDYSDKQCEKYNSSIKNAVEQLIENLDKAFENPDDDCIPEKLRELLKDRLCSNEKITISCTEKKKVKVGRTREYDRCTNRWKFLDKYEQRGGGAMGPDMIEMTYDKLKQGAKITEMTLFHELIHIAENYYGEQKLGKKDISNEDYSYTCTKKYYDDSKCSGKIYPEYENCPPKESECIPCNNYYPPEDPNRKKGK